MNTVFLSDRANDLIRSQSPNFRQTGTKVEGGWWVPLSEDVIMRLCQEMLDGESYSDVVERLLSVRN